MRCGIAFLAAGLVAFGLAASALGADPAKDFAKLEQSYETTPLGWQEAYAEFRPKYDAFAKANAGTELGLSAKLRLLEFAGGYDKTERGPIAEKLVDEILAQHPESGQLDRLPDFHWLVGAKKLGEILRHLEAEGRPERLKARAALYRLSAAVSNKAEQTEVDKYLPNLVGKWRDLPFKYSTYGEMADALGSPLSEKALAIGAKAPEILGKDADGKPLKLSDFKGKVVVVDFFGDW